ncbi:MAG: methionyl-tRNA formyltransferase [Betaproteobacteria bacterium]
MRIVFAGTPAFAERALAAVLDAGHDVSLVLTQPDRPSGRGLRPVASPVKRLALERGLALHQPGTLKDPAAAAPIAAARPDILVVAAYGLLLPPAVLRIAPQGAVNIHASLLPRWRGAAPIQRALLAGDHETGVTIMRMEAGLDTGPVMLERRVAIAADDDAQTLHDRLAEQGAEAIVEALALIAAGGARWVPQPAEGMSYARKIDKSEATVDWSQPCAGIERTLRAFRPSPGAQSMLRGETLKLWRARCVAGSAAPGEVIAAGAEGIVVACGQGALEIQELQRAGGKRLEAAAFLRGFPVAAGERLGAAR